VLLDRASDDVREGMSLRVSSNRDVQQLHGGRCAGTNMGGRMSEPSKRGTADEIFVLGRKVGEHLHEITWLDETERLWLMFGLGIAAGAMVERERVERSGEEP
jgi:hypothetical protein